MLTIVIPTRNRPDFLARLLLYYERVSCPYPILVGDSSDGDCRKEVLNLINHFSKKLSLSLREHPHNPTHGPGEGTISCMAHILNDIQTPYVAFNADDDFLIPRTLKKCVEFLEGHPDYSTVHGEAVLFALKDGFVGGEIQATSRYSQRALEFPLATKRLFENLRKFLTTEFSVKRTSLMRKTWQVLHQLHLDNYWGELLVSCLSVIDGKVKKLEDLYMVRQGHLLQTGAVSRGLFTWLASQNFAEQHRLFSDCLSRALVQCGALNEEEARELVKKAFWAWLSNGLMFKWKANYSQNFLLYQEVLQKLSRRLPHLREAWHVLKSMLPGGQMLLPALLKRSSPYHEDFQPLHEVITSGNSFYPS